MTINYPANFFLPTYYRVKKCNTRFSVEYGGAGSGKSVAHAQHFTNLTFTKNRSILILRKTGNTLKDSVIQEIWDYNIVKCGLSHLFKFHKTNNVITNLITGSKITFRGMDNPEKIKSIAKITNIWMEEASEFDEQDFLQLNLRLRSSENVRFYITFNPIDEDHWLKKRFFDTYDEDVSANKSTYLDNHHLPESYKKELIKLKNTDFNYYQIYALGNWGKLDTGGEFYKNFDVKAVQSLKYDLSKPLHISFDENVNPYITLTIYQLHDTYCIKQIAEICLETPMNTVKNLCREFSKMFPKHEAGVFVYGDASSRKEDTKLEKGQNFYSLILNYLRDYKPSLRVEKSNPPVAMRGNFINDIFAGENKISFAIDEKCVNSIRDFKYLKEDPDGGKLKEKDKNSRTGVIFEKYGHTSDSFDYFVCKAFSKEFSIFKSGGRKQVPMTRAMSARESDW